MDEPTQGVDVGAKAGIFELIAGAAAAGAGVLVCSSDAKELALICDRVLVMRDGRARRRRSRGGTERGAAGQRRARTSADERHRAGATMQAADTDLSPDREEPVDRDAGRTPASRGGVRRPARPQPPGALLSFRNISAIYVFVVMFVVFAIWVPDTFLAGDTWRALIDSQAVTAIARDRPGDRALGRRLRPGDRRRARPRRRSSSPGCWSSRASRSCPAIALTILAGCRRRPRQRPADRQGPDRLVHRHAGHELDPARDDRLGLRAASRSSGCRPRSRRSARPRSSG